MTTNQTFDVAIVGAGVFGAWTAYQLQRAGAEAVLLDAYGPGNSLASSGGESRIIRMGYGPDEVYTRTAQRSLTLWQELLDRINHNGNPRLFHATGVLWLAREKDIYCEAMLETFQRRRVTYDRLDGSQLLERYPQIAFAPGTWGILEPNSGVLLARQAVKALAAQAQAAGVTYLQDAVIPDAPLAHSSGPGAVHNSVLNSIHTASGNKLFARQFVFACGPWLPKLFPSLLSELIHVTRQEVFFFGVPASDSAAYSPERMPAWIDFNDLVYGIPNFDNRGFKIAIDAHGPPFDPETGDRIVSPESVPAVRAYLAKRMPALANAPVTETRVCQYENTSNGDFLIDRHPEFDNVWLVGGGSGHGFKHGPAVGEHVAALVTGDAMVEPRFALASKEKLRERRVF